MQPNLSGKKAVITGGGRGIGFAIAWQLAEAGADVAICGRSRPHLDAALRKLRAKATKGKTVGEVADVSREDEVTRFFGLVDREFGGLDVLVNNAGVGIFGPVGQLSIADWRTTLDTNLSGVFYCSREAILRMKPRGGGAIVNISSLAGKNAFAGGAAYNASKFGLTGLSEAMMQDYRNDNIRVTYIMPGSVNTGFGNSADAAWKMAPEDIAQAVMAVLAMPERTLISRIEIRPAKPLK